MTQPSSLLRLKPNYLLLEVLQIPPQMWTLWWASPRLELSHVGAAPTSLNRILGPHYDRPFLNVNYGTTPTESLSDNQLIIFDKAVQLATLVLTLCP